MSLASSLYPNLRRKITTVNYIFPEGAANNAFELSIFIPTKPCKLVSFKTKLFLRSDMVLNYDHIIPAEPTNYFGGNSCAFVIYRKHTATELPVIPNILDGSEYWTRNEEDLIDYGWMKVDSPGLVTPITQTVNANGTIETAGINAIEGLIAAPTGVGDIGPLDVDLNMGMDFTFTMKTYSGGGTTIDRYNSSGCLDIQLQGTGDRIVLVGVHNAFDDVCTGVIMSGTIEVMIEY